MKDQKRSTRKRQRLTLRSEFNYVKKSGVKQVGKLCVLQVAKAPDGRVRQAIVISRYFSAKAVLRNRARRLLRVAQRDVEEEITEPCWIVLRPRQAMKVAKASQVTEELRNLIRMAGFADQN